MPQLRRTFRYLMAGTAMLTVTVGSAEAATPKEMEARLEALERAVGALQGELQSTRAENAQLREAVARAETKAVEVASAVSAAAAKPAPAPQDGFTVGNGSTRIKLGGFIKTVATFSDWDDGTVAANSLGRDFYLPQTIPIGGKGTTNNDFSAKQTRLWLNLDTTVAGHSLKGYLETDFQTSAGTQGSERTTNGYNLALRRAYVQFDNLTVGQDWSTFQNVAVLPESTDFVGPTEGTVFVRQPLIRFSKALSPAATIHLAIENGETQSAVGPAVTVVENDQDRLPDITARLNVKTGAADLALAGVARQLRVDNGTVDDTAFGWGVSGSGKIAFGPDKRHDIRFMATYGKGIGRYVGLNFSPDAVIDATGQLRTPEVFAGLAALRIGLSPTVRTNLMVGYQDVNYPDGFAPGYFNTFNGQAVSYAGNLFWSPVKGLDLGIEYRHGERELVSGASGQLDRFEFAAKYGF